MRLTRRALLGAGAAGLAATAYGVGARDSEGAPATVPFAGDHQAGIATPAQDRLHFAAFDAAGDADLRALLRAWSRAAERMTARAAAGPANADPLAPPADTGEALELARPAHDHLRPRPVAVRRALRAGLEAPGRARARCRRCPATSSTRRAAAATCACRPAPTTLRSRSTRSATSLASRRGAATLRWSQLGFGRTSSTSREQATPRNLMGFKDGTNNLKREDTGALADHVWVAGSRGWLRGGSYLVARRIRMLIEVWDRASLGDQEQMIGRHQGDGRAARPASAEFDPAPGDAPEGRDRRRRSHVRLAPDTTAAPILRRGYSFTDGIDPRRASSTPACSSSRSCATRPRSWRCRRGSASPMG